MLANRDSNDQSILGVRVEELEQLMLLCRKHGVMQFEFENVKMTFHPMAFEEKRAFPPSEEPAEPVEKKPDVDNVIQALHAAEGRS